MWIYLVNLLMITAVMWFFRKKKNWSYILAFTDLFILAAIRSMDVGRDNGSYERIFNYVRKGYITLSNAKGYEKGYIFLNQLVCKIHGNIRLLLIVVAFLSLIGVFYYIKKNAIYPWISLYIYICMMYYQQNLTIWRQAIAVNIVLIAYCRLQEKHYVQFVLLIVLAVLFHRSAILALAPLMLQKIRLTKKQVFLFVLLFAIVYGFRNQIVQLAFSLHINRLAIYMDAVVSNEGYSQLILYCAMLVFAVYSVLAYYRNIKLQRIKQDGELEVRLQQSIILGILMVGMQLVATYFSTLARAGLYFSVPFVLLLPNFLNCFSQKLNRKIIRYLMYAAFLVFYVFLMRKDNSFYYTMWNG